MSADDFAAAAAAFARAAARSPSPLVTCSALGAAPPSVALQVHGPFHALVIRFALRIAGELHAYPAAVHVLHSAAHGCPELLLQLLPLEESVGDIDIDVAAAAAAPPAHITYARLCDVFAAGMSGQGAAREEEHAGWGDGDAPRGAHEQGVDDEYDALRVRVHDEAAASRTAVDVTLEDHPYLALPCLRVHPCGMAAALAEVMGGAGPAASPLARLAAFLSLALPPVGLRLRPAALAAVVRAAPPGEA